MPGLRNRSVLYVSVELTEPALLSEVVNVERGERDEHEERGEHQKRQSLLKRYAENGRFDCDAEVLRIGAEGREPRDDALNHAQVRQSRGKHLVWWRWFRRHRHSYGPLILRGAWPNYVRPCNRLPASGGLIQCLM